MVNSQRRSGSLFALHTNKHPLLYRYRLYIDLDRKLHLIYSNTTSHCCLCLTEKLSIMEANKETTLNCRTELVSKCRHQNKFYLLRFVPSVTRQNNYRSTYMVTRCLSSLDVLPPAIQKLYTATISIATRQSAILSPA